MNLITEKNERRSRRHAMILAIGLHVALVSMLYFKMAAEDHSTPAQPVKVNQSKDARTATLP